MKRLLTIAFSLIIAFGAAFANQTLVKGKVIDEKDGEPKEVELIFEDASGKKIKAKSNKLNGEYQQLLEGGTSYEVTIYAGDVFRKSYDLTARSSDSAYVEQNHVFNVTRMDAGRELMRFAAFNGSSLNGTGQSELKGLNKMMRFNRGLTLDIVVGDAAKKSAVEEVVMKNKRLADRVNVVVDSSVGGDLVYRVNKNELLFD